MYDIFLMKKFSSDTCCINFNIVFSNVAIILIVLCQKILRICSITLDTPNKK